ncbi:MAG TPA: hypothetical protein VI819_01705 [Patescibacteria group bacterium]|nr:hypothetical protein [Patescibacteria group bacterium]
MEEIQYRVNRFKRGVDNFVRVITFIAFLLFLLSFYIYKFKAGKIYQNQVALCDVVLSQGLTQDNPLDNPIHSFLLSSKDECFTNASKAVNSWVRTSFIALDITILLPLVYFGGGRLASETASKLAKKKEVLSSES